jgi:Uma2 family endonuclease
MSTVAQELPPLIAGDHLSRDEFLRRWEAMPQIKRAELIRGVVYMPSPVSPEHGSMELNVGFWLGYYKMLTPGCEGGNNTTWLMLDDESPQLDISLWVLPEYGGRARLRGGLLQGAPEFLSEVCRTSTAFDLHQKLEVYQEAGVQEYLAVLMFEQEVRWHRLSRRRFRVVPAPADGIYRSTIFPGLWLDSAALLGNDLVRVVAVLNEGLASPEHAAFVKKLALRRRS